MTQTLEAGAGQGAPGAAPVASPLDETMEAERAERPPSAPRGTPSTATGAGGGAEVLQAGTLLGKYRLDRIVGSGGMGVVWAAVDPDLDRTVAIKVLRVAGDDPLLRSRLLREARAMARLKHGNVLTVYEVGTHKNRDYIAMELIEGSSLDGWLTTKPARPQIVAAMMAAGRGLAAAHAAGIVHRDFKPHNVLRDQDGRVLVTDFGLARGQIEDQSEAPLELAVTGNAGLAGGRGPGGIADGSQSRRRVMDSVLDSPLTQTGVLIGTPAYMAPEQFLGGVPDPRTDQFAFCVAMWEALTGARPFRGGSLDELQQAAKRGVATVAADLPRGVRAVLQRGLEPDPDKRWPDMTSLLTALERAFSPPSRRGLWVGALVAVAAAALIVGVVMITSASRGGGGSGSGDGATAKKATQVRIITKDDGRSEGNGGVRFENGQMVIPMPKIDLSSIPGMPPAPPAPPEAPEAPEAAAAAPGEDDFDAHAERLADQLEAATLARATAAAARATAAEVKQQAKEQAKELTREQAKEQAREQKARLAAAKKMCRPAEQQFATAWSPEQSAELAQTKETLQKAPARIGAMAVLDGLREEWIRAYDRVCQHPEDPAFERRHACLLDLRDEVARTTKALRKMRSGEDFSELDLASLAATAAATALCVGDEWK